MVAGFGTGLIGMETHPSVRSDCVHMLDADGCTQTRVVRPLRPFLKKDAQAYGYCNPSPATMNDDTLPASSSPLRLLQRPCCVLCLEAEHVLSLAGIDHFERVDIERDPALEQRYGSRIPVALDAHGRELDWPFDADRLQRWLSEGRP